MLIEKESVLRIMVVVKLYFNANDSVEFNSASAISRRWKADKKGDKLNKQYGEEKEANCG